MPWKCSRLIQPKPCTHLQCIPGFVSATSCFTLLLPRASRDPKIITVEGYGGTRIPSKSHLRSSTATDMKFISTLALLASLLVVIATRVSYYPFYDNGRQSLATVACSDEKNGLLTKDYKTFQDLPSFPNIGASSAITGPAGTPPTVVRPFPIELDSVTDTHGSSCNRLLLERHL